MPHDISRTGEAFKKSLKTWGGTSAKIFDVDEYLLNEVSPFKMFSEEHAPPRLRDRGDEWIKLLPVLRAFTNAYLIHELDRIFDGPGDITFAIDTMDSPIEVLFFAALVLVARENYVGVECERNHPTLKFESHQNLSTGGHRLSIVIFPSVGDYRVDFPLRATGTEIRRAQDGDDSNWTEHRIEKSMIVECDGHDFHEKTKEQAHRDKERDRFLQGLGHPVFRYTGSELFRDPFYCAVEAFKYLTGKEIATELSGMD